MKRFCALILILSVALGALGCTSASRSQFGALGEDHVVTVYNMNGEVLKQYHSNGKVMTESGSDGWFFTDRTSGKLVRISGAALIEITPEK